MTQRSLAKLWVRLECASFLGIASKEQNGQESPRRVILVKADPCEIPFPLNAFPWIDGTSLSVEAVVAKIVDALSSEGGLNSTAHSVSTAVSAVPLVFPGSEAPTPSALQRLGFQGRVH